MPLVRASFRPLLAKDNDFGFASARGGREAESGAGACLAPCMFVCFEMHSRRISRKAAPQPEARRLANVRGAVGKTERHIPLRGDFQWPFLGRCDALAGRVGN